MQPPLDWDHQQPVNARRVVDHGALAKQHPTGLRDDLVEATTATMENCDAFGGEAQDLEAALDTVAAVSRAVDLRGSPFAAIGAIAALAWLLRSSKLAV
jgi:hypothetical protein